MDSFSCSPHFIYLKNMKMLSRKPWIWGDATWWRNLTLQRRHGLTCGQLAVDVRLFVFCLSHELVRVCEINRIHHYNPFLVYCRELAPGTVSLTGDRVQGDDSKHDSHYSVQWGQENSNQMAHRYSGKRGLASFSLKGRPEGWDFIRNHWWIIFLHTT